MFDENSVAERVLSGDGSAFDRLVDLYIQRVYLYTLYYLGQEEDAQKASVEIFCEVYRKLDSLRDDELFTWVMRIAAEVCAEHQRHRRGAASRVEDAEEDLLETAIRQQLALLQRQQREILLLHDVCGLPDEKVARVLKLDVNGVRLRLSRARKNLRDQLVRVRALQRPKILMRTATKDCTQYRELCSRYVDEYISDEDKQALLAHIQECQSCAAYLNDLTLIGRSLAHMEQRTPPAELRERILQAAREQEQNQVHWKRWFRLPLIVFFCFSVLVLLLISSGAVGGLFINNSGIIQDDRYTEGLDAQEEYTVREELDIPDNVTSSSYAFVIAASGGTQLPELSTSANLLASSESKDVAYYSVNNDIAQVQKLTEVLQSLGYKLESVNNRHLVISGSAQKGLLIIIHSNKNEAKTGSAAAE